MGGSQVGGPRAMFEPPRPCPASSTLTAQACATRSCLPGLLCYAILSCGAERAYGPIPRRVPRTWSEGGGFGSCRKRQECVCRGDTSALTMTPTMAATASAAPTSTPTTTPGSFRQWLAPVQRSRLVIRCERWAKLGRGGGDAQDPSPAAMEAGVRPGPAVAAVPAHLHLSRHPFRLG